MKIQKTIRKFDDIVVGQIVENEVNWSTHEEDSVDKTQQVRIQEGSLWTKLIYICRVGMNWKFQELVSHNFLINAVGLISL